MKDFIKKLENAFNNALIKYGSDKMLRGLIAAWVISLASPLGLFWMVLLYVAMLILTFIKEKYVDDSFKFEKIATIAKGGAVSLALYIPINLLSSIL